MRRALLVSSVLIASYASAARAQSSIKLSDIAGTWDNKAMVGPNDSVVTRSVLTLSTDKNAWTVTYPTRQPIPVRVVAMGGDSVVTEVGPYPSVLRPGQTVTLLHTVTHYKGDKATGWFEAHYSSGDVVKGKSEATRRK